MRAAMCMSVAFSVLKFLFCRTISYWIISANQCCCYSNNSTVAHRRSDIMYFRTGLQRVQENIIIQFFLM